MGKARYVMVGGFLGAGKTTALLRLAERLKAAGRRVGLITNDQSVGLVDTALLSAHDLPVEEITGGCFCCRFTSLTDAAERLSKAERPDVFLAEPVGSCTDLTATVSYPLRRMYGDGYSVAPYSVLVDPVRAERILGLATGKSFSPKVVYIYLKQLEEADIIVVNKTDILDAARLDRLTAALRERFPKARVVAMSARDGTNVAAWADRVAAEELGTGPAMEVDYDTYAEGEALLGWLNLTAAVSADRDFDGNAYLAALAGDLHRRLAAAGTEVAHLKMTLSPAEGNDLAVVNLVRTDGTPEASHRLAEPLAAGELIVNLRAEADPAALRAAAEAALKETALAAGIQAHIEHAEAFRPGRPVPTHRLSEG
ncbi:MAG: GTP-binding protein [Gemmataceae bacterium]